MTTKKSPMLTDIDNKTLVDSGKYAGVVRSSHETVALLTTDIDADDVILMLEVPSNAKLLSVKIYNDDLDSNATETITADVGFYAARGFTDSNGTVYADDGVIDFDALATDIITLQDPNTLGVELRYEVQNITTVQSEVWQLAGLASNPNLPLRVAVTIGTVAATAVAGDLTLHVEYTTKA